MDCEFGSDRLIIKGTLLREQSTFSSVSRLLEGIPGSVHLLLYAHALLTQ